MKGGLRNEFIERVKTDFDSDFAVENLIHDLCDEIGRRLFDVCAELKRIKGSREIDAIRSIVEDLVDDLW